MSRPILVLALLVVLAGCSGASVGGDAGASGTDGPTTVSPSAFPAGADSEGLDNATRLVVAGTDRLWPSSFTVDATFEQEVYDEEGNVVQRFDQTRYREVDPDRSRYSRVRYSAPGLENATTYWDGETVYRRNDSGVHRRPLAPSALDPRQQTEAWLLVELTRGVDFRFERTRTVDGEARFVYTATGFTDAAAYRSGLGVTTKTGAPSATLVVDGDGIVREFSYRNVHHYEEATQLWEGTVTVSAVGDTDPERPAWVPE